MSTHAQPHHTQNNRDSFDQQWRSGAGQEVEDFNRDGDQGKVNEGLRHLYQVFLISLELFEEIPAQYISSST